MQVTERCDCDCELRHTVGEVLRRKREEEEERYCNVMFALL